MKEEDRQELIQYRPERAGETMEEPLLMQREKHWNVGQKSPEGKDRSLRYAIMDARGE